MSERMGTMNEQTRDLDQIIGDYDRLCQRADYVVDATCMHPNDGDYLDGRMQAITSNTGYCVMESLAMLDTDPARYLDNDHKELGRLFGSWNDAPSREAWEDGIAERYDGLKAAGCWMDHGAIIGPDGMDIDSSTYLDDMQVGTQLVIPGMARQASVASLVECARKPVPATMETQKAFVDDVSRHPLSEPMRTRTREALADYDSLDEQAYRNLSDVERANLDTERDGDGPDLGM